MTIFIVILNYKTYEDLQSCIKSLSLSDLPKGHELKVIVIDSEFNSKELSRLKVMFRKVLFIPKKDNLGVGKGYNVGFKKILKYKPEYILMATPDIRVEENTISELIKVMNSDVKIGIVVPKMLLSKNNRKIYFIKGKIDKHTKSGGHIDYLKLDIGQYDKKEFIESDFVNCSVALIRSELFKKVGFWDEKYFLYYEDVDWCMRVKDVGYKTGVRPSAVAYHKESSSVKKGSYVQEYYTTRNHLYFVRKNFNISDQIVSYIYYLKEIVELVSSRKSEDNNKLKIKLAATRDFIFGRLGKQPIT